jgi:hypothetical protein
LGTWFRRTFTLADGHAQPLCNAPHPPRRHRLSVSPRGIGRAPGRALAGNGLARPDRRTARQRQVDAACGACTRAGASGPPVALHDGCRRLPEEITALELNATDLLIVDGYEQLSWLARRRLAVRRRRLGFGLLVTAHADAGLPTVFATSVSLELAQSIVAELLGRQGGRLAEEVQADDVAWAFAEQRGNLRETLFRLYDLVERRSRAGPAGAHWPNLVREVF